MLSMYIARYGKSFALYFVPRILFCYLMLFDSAEYCSMSLGNIETLDYFSNVFRIQKVLIDATFRHKKIRQAPRLCYVYEYLTPIFLVFSATSNAFFLNET